MAGRFCTERQLCFVFYTDNEAAIVTIQQPLSREVFWHIYAKIPRHTSKNAITEGDFKCVFARNCEGTEQLRRFANDNTRRGIETNENVQGQNVQDDLQ